MRLRFALLFNIIDTSKGYLIQLKFDIFWGRPIIKILIIIAAISLLYYEGRSLFNHLGPMRIQKLIRFIFIVVDCPLSLERVE
jgi:hypothetical protein